VVEKGIGIAYPIEKPTNRKGGHADEERIPQGQELTMSELGSSLEELTGLRFQIRCVY